jgi:hypothetical protein
VAVFKTNLGGQAMKRKPVVPLLMLFGIVAIFGYSGCSIIGLCAGASIDNARSDYDTIPGSHVASVELGKDITLTKITGEELKGEYLGLRTPADSQYARVYNEYREKHKKEFSLPALFDTISIVTLEPPKEYKGEFSGFENQYMWIMVMGVSGIMREKIDMNKLEKISDRSGNLIEVQKLIDLSLGGKIPAPYTEVTLRTDSDTTRIPTASVSRIEIPNSKTARWYGLALGACIDIIVCIDIWYEMHRPWFSMKWD